MTTFKYIGSTPQTRSTLLMLGRTLGCQNSRKMTIGDAIAENANNGNGRFVAACEAHPELFEVISK